MMDLLSRNQRSISPENIFSIKILNMKRTKVMLDVLHLVLDIFLKNEKFDNLILMDGDGEDRPEEIKSLINKIKENPKKSVIAKRVKRSEGIFLNLYINYIN